MSVLWAVACVCVALVVVAETTTEKDVLEENLTEPIKQTRQLTTIDYGAKIGVNISITLSKQEYSEVCYLQTPQGDIYKLDEAQINGVQVYTTSTNFVSCRVVLGPLEQQLLGTWTLCGTHAIGQITYERCQPGHISWAIENPEDNWASTTQARFNHVVSYGFRLTPIVRGSGTVNTCHVVTPAGEDIAITVDSDYPGLFRFMSRDTTACNVSIGPIDENYIGDWELYGTFRSNAGFNLLILPMNFFLYDEYDPYNQAYNVSSIANQTHIVSPGGVLILTVTGSGVRTGCELITNTGENYNENTIANFTAATFVNNNNAACRIEIGPMTHALFGDWILIGKFNRNNLFNEIHLPLHFIEEDPANPVPDHSNRTIEYLPARSFITRYGQSHVVSTASGQRIVTESCHIRTPNHLQYILREGSVLPGVEGVVGSGISCGVRVQVNDESVLGEWMLIARINVRGVLIERRVTFVFSIEGIDPETEVDENETIENSKEDSAENDKTEDLVTLPTILYRARKGNNVTMSLSRQEYTEECYLQAPHGNVHKLENVQIDGIHVYPKRSNFVSCRVVIGPMHESLLGTWTLCGKGTVGQIIHERCQPGDLSWANNNPADNWATTVHARFNHAVHYGFTLSPLVRGTGTLHTCHVITPDGEDIPLSTESDYPGLRRIVARDTTLCNVAIGAINEQFLGDWAIYGTYDSTVMGFNVVTQPMTFFLYDEENPYSQAYNVTTLDMERHVLIQGLTIVITVTGSGTRNGCEFVTNNGERFDQTTSASLQGVSFVNNNNAACRLEVGPVTKDMFGDWLLIGKFVRNNILFQELQLPLRLLEEDPANPIPDDINRTIEYLNAQEVYTSFGTSHTFSTTTANRLVTDSCHIKTPDNLQYILRSGLVLPGFQTATGNGISCGVQVHVNNDDAIGEWMLIARITLNGARIERRLPFKIYVEEEVNAVPKTATIAEGNNLFMRLENPTPLFDTCVLIGPTRNNADHDDNFVDTCGFIVKDVTIADAGTWEIEYGTGKKYRAPVRVDVTPRFEVPENSVLTWTQDASINETIGPEDTVFCRVDDPSGLTVFHDFGRCNIVLDRVRSEHAGVWKMTIASSGRIRAETFEFLVKLSEAEGKASMTTSVVTEKPSVTLSCQVATNNEVTACKFRDPSGKVLMVSQGIGEDRYSFHTEGKSPNSEDNRRECGLRITNPLVEDLGLWRCVIETETDTYYGFLTVLCPWAMLDPAVVAAVVSDSTLTAETSSIKSIEGNSVVMRCSVQSAIRYCYFRAQNGTVYTVSPSGSEWFEYAGAGLDAGECGIRFPALQTSDSGRWGCHVGFEDHAEPEQRAQIQLHIDALMVADQYHLTDSLETLVVRGQVHSQLSLEYCRYVRMDGLGFTSEEVPTGYEDHSLLANGKCEIRIPNPSILDRHPWTVVAKAVGYKAELARSTQHTLMEPEEESKPPVTESDPSVTESDPPVTQPEHTLPSEILKSPRVLVVWSCVLAVSVCLFIIGLLLGPKNNRDWTFRQTNSFRDSLRKRLPSKSYSSAKEVPPAAQDTPMAA